VHLQIIISRYSYIDYSHESVGIALARFERSTLPEHEDARIVVLRFVKIITPVKCVIPVYDGHLCCPKEGELYQKTPISRESNNPKVWSVNIDKPTGGPLARGLYSGIHSLFEAVATKVATDIQL
jgi:hypothetical protein